MRFERMYYIEYEADSLENALDFEAAMIERVFGGEAVTNVDAGEWVKQGDE